MVQAKRMEAHNFDELLSQVADPAWVEGETNGAAHWYLKDAEDAGESALEDKASEVIEAFIAGHLEKNPEEEGVHYSDIFEHYVYTVKEQPRRSLADWLLDYFYKTDIGTYRLPLNEEEERLKKEGRAKGVSRHIRRHLTYIEQGVPVPEDERPSDATMADWVRHCKRAGMYEQGKTLYERGGLNTGRFSDEGQVNVEEDYQVCVRMLDRIEQMAQNSTKGTKKGKKK